MTELSATDLEQGFSRPLRSRVKHTFCGSVSLMRITDAVQLAHDPESVETCWCLLCGRRLPVFDFVWWPDGESVGS
jgi:hypothetical protein